MSGASAVELEGGSDDGVGVGVGDFDGSESDNSVDSTSLVVGFSFVSVASSSVEDSATTDGDDDSASSGADASVSGVSDGVGFFITCGRVNIVIARGSTETMSPGFSLIFAFVC